MNLTKKIAAILLVFVMMFALASCAEEETTELDIGTINIGVIYNGKMDEEGTFANQHFAAFENAYSSAGAGGGQINQRDGVVPGDKKAMDTTMADLLARGCKLIVTTDPGYYADVAEHAKANPTVNFAAMAEYGVTPIELDNLATFDIRTFETEYLVGMMAASASANGKIGYVDDVENAVDVNAFAEGAKAVNPAAAVSLVVTDDVKAGVEAVEKAGCDTVYSRNFAIDEEGTMFFEVPSSVTNDMCVNTLGADGKFITASCYNLNRLYTEIITDTVNEKFDEVKNFSTGVKEGVIDVRPAEDDAVKAKVDAVKDKLFAGDTSISKYVELSAYSYTVIK
ncbi:MAG: BMP family ABC transporter substrate-binding protein [Clostridia bacterium]|nr:BMP family ABC transporter substrate-binding protein [Clostridia bacterium]